MPQSTLHPGQGPRLAHRMLRESQTPWLVVLDRERRPVGVLWDEDVAGAVRLGHEQLPWSKHHQMPIVRDDTPISELFAQAAQHRSPLVVVDDNRRFVGVIPRVTLLTAASHAPGDPASELPPPEPAAVRTGASVPVEGGRA